VTLELNLEVCRAIAAQHGLPLQYVVKEYHVFDVLGRITMETAPEKNAVFKGGTALNKVFLGGVQRFSEDLDFDLDARTPAEAREWSKQLAAKLEHGEGNREKEYGITEFRRVGGTIQFYCVFESVLGGRDHVRVDVAPKKIVSAKPVEVKTAKSDFTQQFVTGFAVYSLEDLTARKLHALATRCEGKDVYDVFNALPSCGAMRKPIEKMLESEGESGSAKDFLDKAIRRLRGADARKLRNITNPFIPSSKRPRDWGELKNDLELKLEKLA
jgi:predicted nucleotidyltransferase component of viral defense system